MNALGQQTTIRILSVAYSRDVLKRRHQEITAAGWNVTSTASKRQAIKLLSRRQFEVVICGHRVPIYDRNEIAIKAKQLQHSHVIFLYDFHIAYAKQADAVITIKGGTPGLIEAMVYLLDPSCGVCFSN